MTHQRSNRSGLCAALLALIGFTVMLPAHGSERSRDFSPLAPAPAAAAKSSSSGGGCSGPEAAHSEMRLITVGGSSVQTSGAAALCCVAWTCPIS